jgi:hypothetical protein
MNSNALSGEEREVRAWDFLVRDTVARHIPLSASDVEGTWWTDTHSTLAPTGFSPSILLDIFARGAYRDLH